MNVDATKKIRRKKVAIEITFLLFMLSIIGITTVVIIFLSSDLMMIAIFILGFGTMMGITMTNKTLKELKKFEMMSKLQEHVDKITWIFNIIDMDGTILHPSPYNELGWVSPIKQRLKLIRSIEFEVKLIECQKAAWLDTDGELLEDAVENVIITGRYPENDDATKTWLYKNGIKVDRIHYLKPRTYEEYLKRKKEKISRVIEEAMKYALLVSIEIRVFDDNETVCNWVRDNYPYIKVHRVKEGLLMNDDVDDKRHGITC